MNTNEFDPGKMLSQLVNLIDEPNLKKETIEEELSIAYTFLKNSLEAPSAGKKGADPDKALQHSLLVAYRLAGWHLDIYTIKAGLLHVIAMNFKTKKLDSKTMDLIRHQIDANTADILWRYTRLKAQLLKIEERMQTGNFIAEKQWFDLTPEAFYIIIAHRIEELLREQDHPTLRIRRLAQNTEDFLLPEIQKQEAMYLADILEEVCFKITHPEQYEKIHKQVKSMQDMNHYSYQKFSQEMAHLLNLEDEQLPPVLKKYKRYFRKFDCQPRAFNSLYKFLARSDYMDQPQKSVEERGLALYIMHLVVKDSDTQFEDEFEAQKRQVSLFLKFYADMLSIPNLKPRFTIHLISRNPVYKNASFIISDEVDNFYILTIRTESEYRRYLYGRISDPEFKDPTEETDSRKISVRKMDGSRQSLPKGSTALDLAFQIHQKMGLEYHHALINGTKKPIYYQLKNDDQVEIILNSPKSTIQPDLTWLKHVQTPLAKNELIRYFKRHYRLDNSNIIYVQEKKGNSFSIESGATILDYAFLRYDTDALHCQTCYLEKNTCSPGQVLRENDRVEIILADTVQATLDWFLYVNTQHAREILIEYFKNQHNKH